MKTAKIIPPEKTAAVLRDVLHAVTEGDPAATTRAVFRAYVHLQDTMGAAYIEPRNSLDYPPEIS